MSRLAETIAGSSPALTDVTPDAIRQARRDRGVTEGALRAAVGMTLSEWRRFMRGDPDPE